MTTYDMPRAQAVGHLQASVGSYLASQILTAIDSGGGARGALSITSNYSAGDPIPASSDIVIVRPGESGAITVPSGVGAVIFTGPAGVQVALAVEAPLAVKMTEGADIVRVTTQPTAITAEAVAFDLGAGDDVFIGGRDIRNDVVGGDGDDMLVGGDRGDTFYVGHGSDRVDAGAGYDRAHLPGSRDGYVSITHPDGSVSLTNKATGEVATLTDLEYIAFEDGSVVLNVAT
jgi:Ca2+-binding RTX toxin-like protein